MRLADDPITITVDGVGATLRPSLRAAYQLQRRHGFPAIIAGIMESNLSIVADIVSFSADNDTVLPALLREIERSGVLKLDPLKPCLFAYISSLIGIDDHNDEPAPAKGKPLTFEEFFEQLFEIGTGWLGWTPETTWKATPAEIMAAQRGHVAKLKATYGSGDNGKPEHDPLDLPTDEQIRAGINMLKANTRRGKAK